MLKLTVGFKLDVTPGAIAQRRHREKPGVRERERAAAKLARKAGKRAHTEQKTKDGRLDPNLWSKYVIANLRYRANKKGFDFNITAADIPVPQVCPVLGIPIVLGGGKRAIVHSGTPSVDRINNDLGYVRGNVRVISNRANRIKMDATPAELRAIADYIERECGK